MKRRSIEPTYDSRDSGLRYHVTTTINGRPLVFRQPIADPFVRTMVTVGNFRDLLRGLLRRRLVVEVTVGADAELMNDVLELDANTLLPNSTRRDEFNDFMRDAVTFHIRGENEQ